MPIIGKTDSIIENDRIDLDVIGRVWVGDAKTENSAGRTLNDKFRIECNDRTRDKFIEHYGSDRPDKINIFLPYATPNECFETWMEAYTAQSLQHRCNGERITQKMVKVPYTGAKGEQLFSWQRRDVDEPCLKGDAPECAACGKGSGRFFFYIRELYASGMGATKAWMMSVSGVHNLTGLHTQLRALYKQYGALNASPVPSPWTFGFIPFTLTRVEKKIMRPNQEKATVNGKTVYNQTGTRSRGSYWAISIAEDEEWMSTLQRFMAFQEAQRLGGSPEAIALIGGNIPVLPGYQETALWGSTERQIRNATNTRQIAAAIDVVRDEVSQGNLPPDAIAQAETLANNYEPASKPKAKPKKAVVDEEEAPAIVLLKKFESSVQKAETIEQLERLQEWIKAPKQWRIAETDASVANKVMDLIRDRILAISAVNVKPPGLDGTAIDAEVLTEEYPDFDTEESE